MPVIIPPVAGGFNPATALPPRMGDNVPRFLNYKDGVRSDWVVPTDTQIGFWPHFAPLDTIQTVLYPGSWRKLLPALPDGSCAAWPWYENRISGCGGLVIYARDSGYDNKMWSPYFGRMEQCSDPNINMDETGFWYYSAEMAAWISVHESAWRPTLFDTQSNYYSGGDYSYWIWAEFDDPNTPNSWLYFGGTDMYYKKQIWWNEAESTWKLYDWEWPWRVNEFAVWDFYYEHNVTGEKFEMHVGDY